MKTHRQIKQKHKFNQSKRFIEKHFILSLKDQVASVLKLVERHSIAVYCL